LSDLKSDLLSYVKGWHTGRGNVITFSFLKDIFHQKDDRKLRALLVELRHDGHPIITCSRGVYYSTDPEDARLLKAGLQKRIYGLYRDLKDLDPFMAKETMKQLELF
jgi:hypothetical protein